MTEQRARRTRDDRPRAGAVLKPFYKVGELAALARCHRNQMARLLESHGVPFDHVGSDRIVHIHKLKEAWPDLWESILTVESFREVA